MTVQTVVLNDRFARRFDMMTADFRFDMTDDSHFDMTRTVSSIWWRLSLRKEGFLTLLLTIKMTVVFCHNQEMDTVKNRTENHIKTSSLFDLETRVISKRKHGQKALKTLSSQKESPVYRKSLLSPFRTDYPPWKEFRSIYSYFCYGFTGFQGAKRTLFAHLPIINL